MNSRALPLSVPLLPLTVLSLLPPVGQRRPEILVVDRGHAGGELVGKGIHRACSRIADGLLGVARAGDDRAHARQLGDPGQSRRRGLETGLARQ